jgi:hypothetical protein
LASGSAETVAETATEVLLKTKDVWRRVLFEKPRPLTTRLFFVKQLYDLAASVGKFAELNRTLDFDLPEEQQELRRCVDSLAQVRSTLFRVLDDMRYSGLAEQRFERRVSKRLFQGNEQLQDREEAWRLALNGSFRELVRCSVKLLPQHLGSLTESVNGSTKVSIDTASATLKKLLNDTDPLRRDFDRTIELIGQNYAIAANATAIPGFAGTLWRYRCQSAGDHSIARDFRIIAHYEVDVRTLYPILVYPKIERNNVSAREVVQTIQALESSLEEVPKS